MYKKSNQLTSHYHSIKPQRRHNVWSLPKSNSISVREEAETISVDFGRLNGLRVNVGMGVRVTKTTSALSHRVKAYSRKVGSPQVYKLYNFCSNCNNEGVIHYIDVCC